ncbi:MAG: hypothetical protein GXP49_17290 [Deltaproteobacteria bacterium]|nr:hypothetical protein [Deltaproteobacteria bacterium]
MKDAFLKSEIRRIEKAITRKWRHLMEDETIHLTGSFDDDSVQVELLFKNSDESLYYPMQCRVEMNKEGIEPYQAKDLAIDFLDWYLGEYLESGRKSLLHLDWAEHRFGEYSIFARGEVRNKRLDELADALLEGRIDARDLNELTGEKSKKSKSGKPGKT